MHRIFDRDDICYGFQYEDFVGGVIFYEWLKYRFRNNINIIWM